MAERGKYIVIEGNDGTGKSTQARMLARYILDTHGIETYMPEEPAGTPVADAIRTVIKDGSIPRDPKTNVLLFTASRAEIWQQAKQELKIGKFVISARNYISTLAYQGYGEGVDADLILRTTMDYTDEEYMAPDHTIVLDLSDAAERQRRIDERGQLEKPDAFESKGESFQDRVNNAYHTIAEQRGYPIIDAAQSPEAIQQRIRQLLGL